MQRNCRRRCAEYISKSAFIMQSNIAVMAYEDDRRRHVHVTHTTPENTKPNNNDYTRRLTRASSINVCIAILCTDKRMRAIWKKGQLWTGSVPPNVE